MEFFIGMMVIGIVAGVFVMTLLFRSESGIFVGGASGKRMTIEFKNGSGISQNSLVLKNGIKIGRVFSAELIDNIDESHVLVTFELTPEAHVYSNEAAKINRTFLGDASIEIVDNPDFDPNEEVKELASGAKLIGLKTLDLMGTVTSIEGDLGAALQNVNQAAAGMTAFMGKLNTFLGDDQEIQIKKDNLKKVFEELAATLIETRELAGNMNEVVSDQELKASIQDATARIPSIMARIDEIAGKANVFMDNASTVSGDVRRTLARADTTFDLVDKNLDNINVFTTSLAENGPEMMTALNEGSVEIKGAIDQVKIAIDNIAEFVENVNDQMEDKDSPIGMLTDKEVGAGIRKIVANVEELTEKAYPIMDDARVFSNKIAHKPSSLIWDKTTSKGGSLSERFGWQTKSPSGGVTSPLYRQTPTGAKICERNYYEPRADRDVMDPQTRAIYESEVLNRETLRGGGSNYLIDDCDYGPDYSSVVPVGSPNVSKWDEIGASIKERTNRIRWSLDSFWSRFSPKRRVPQEVEAANYVQNGNAMGLNMVGYEGYAGAPIGGFVGQATYAQYSDAYGSSFVDAVDHMNPGACSVYPNDLGATCEVPSCEIPTYDSTCGVPSCDVPESCGAYGCDTGSALRTGGVGYQGNNASGANSDSGTLGPYSSKAPQQMDIDLNAADAEQIEELPSSINRPIGTQVDFEDDGLPAEYAPPTKDRQR